MQTVIGPPYGDECLAESVRTPVQAPRANTIAERLVRSLRQECLDHILPLSEGHLRALLAEFVSYYNQDRPHRSLRLETPVQSRRQPHGKVLSRPVLNGLHHVYRLLSPSGLPGAVQQPRRAHAAKLSEDRHSGASALHSNSPDRQEVTSPRKRGQVQSARSVPSRAVLDLRCGNLALLPWPSPGCLDL